MMVGVADRLGPGSTTMWCSSCDLAPLAVHRAQGATRRTVVHLDYRPDNFMFGTSPMRRRWWSSMADGHRRLAWISPTLRRVLRRASGGGRRDARRLHARLTVAGVVYDADTMWRDTGCRRCSGDDRHRDDPRGRDRAGNEMLTVMGRHGGTLDSMPWICCADMSSSGAASDEASPRRLARCPATLVGFGHRAHMARNVLCLAVLPTSTSRRLLFIVLGVAATVAWLRWGRLAFRGRWFHGVSASPPPRHAPAALRPVAAAHEFRSSCSWSARSRGSSVAGRVPVLGRVVATGAAPAA
jgi:hypothetical protein